MKGGFGGLHKRTDLYKPVIAAVNGFALGGGFEIVMSCDIIVAAEHATFGLPEPRVGLMAGAGGVHRLPRQIPYHIAMGVMLTGKRISARDGERYGLVNEVVPAADLLADRAPLGGRDPGVRADLDSRQQGSRGRGSRHDPARPRSGTASRGPTAWRSRRTSSKDRARSPRSASRTGPARSRFCGLFASGDRDRRDRAAQTSPQA